MSAPADDALARSALFKDVDPAVIARCQRQGERRQLQAGEILLAPTRPNRHIFVLLAGRLTVHLHAPEHPPLVVLEPGECAGEISALDQQNPSAFVLAQGNCAVLALPVAALWRLLDQSPRLVRNLLCILARRARYSNEATLAQEQYAYVDPLTGLHNRRWLETVFARIQQRAQLNGEPLCLIMADLDHFKRCNDQFGHPVGDQVLKAVAAALSQRLRPQDMIARYGGEEFAIALLGAAPLEALAIAERLRAAVAATTVTVAGSSRPLPPVTLSLGVAGMLPDDSLETLVARADAALYRAKAAGRNRVAR